jgi:Mn-dependent transcriptional regulator
MRESGEDYLETIYLLSRKKADVYSVDIADEFNYSKPSITRAMKILKENGYITKDEANRIRLTDKGVRKAQSIYERHQVLTEFLILNGISPATAGKDACRMEHDISEETFLRLKETVAKKKNS